MSKTNGEEVLDGSDGVISCQTSQGIELEATLRKLTRFSVVFEVCSPACLLRMSEVLGNLKVTLQGRTAYSGRAVVTNLIQAGSAAICEARFDENWIDVQPVAASQGAGMQAEFDDFMRHWQKNYRVRPEFKVVVADMQSLLADLRLWLDHVELGIRSLPAADRVQEERIAARTLNAATSSVLAALFEKFEVEARAIPPEFRAAHSLFCRRQLHPLLLCSPFMHRIYAKPLGYAGDYEMVSMILRDPHEGSSLYAKLLNGFILSQTPAIAHRNRVSVLTRKLVEETLRVSRQGRAAKIFNVACGPAGELQAFFREHELSSRAHITLLDSNDETLMYIGRVLEELGRSHGRHASIKLVKKSVLQLLKQGGRPKGLDAGYDFIYCAGLFDYLQDRICKMLMELFYELLAPNGLLLVTNVDASNPIRNIMEYIFEWHLVYRTGQELGTLAPVGAPADAVAVTADPTSSNVFLEIRKPPAAP